MLYLFSAHLHKIWLRGLRNVDVNVKPGCRTGHHVRLHSRFQVAKLLTGDAWGSFSIPSRRRSVTGTEKRRPERHKKRGTRRTYSRYCTDRRSQIGSAQPHYVLLPERSRLVGGLQRGSEALRMESTMLRKVLQVETLFSMCKRGYNDVLEKLIFYDWLIKFVILNHSAIFRGRCLDAFWLKCDPNATRILCVKECLSEQSSKSAFF